MTCHSCTIIGGCGCVESPESAAFLKKYGAIHAAKMHEKHAARGNNSFIDWTGLDWRIHIEEEDRFLRPFMERYFPCLLCVYDTDHAAFISDIAKHGKIMDLKRLDSHSKLEDYVISELIKKGY